MFLTASNAVLLVPQLSVCCCCGSGAKNDKIYCPQFGCTGAAWQCYPPDALQCLCGLGLNLISLSSYLKCTELPSCNILLSTLYWHNMNFARIKVDSREGAMSLFQLVLLFLALFLSLLLNLVMHTSSSIAFFFQVMKMMAWEKSFNLFLFLNSSCIITLGAIFYVAFSLWFLCFRIN